MPRVRLTVAQSSRPGRQPPETGGSRSGPGCVQAPERETDHDLGGSAMPDDRPGARATLDTPFGPFTVVVDADGVVLAGGLDDGPRRRAPPARPPLPAARGDRRAARARGGDGRRRGLPRRRAPLRPRRCRCASTADRSCRRCGRACGRSPRARRSPTPTSRCRAGRPLAPRGAAQACARNAVGLFVPDHRVRRGDGSLGGFRWGLTVKEGLLAAEAAHAAGDPRDLVGTHRTSGSSQEAVGSRRTPPRPTPDRRAAARCRTPLAPSAP